jgi:hypothetical protein
MAIFAEFERQSLLIEFENKNLAKIKSPSLTTGIPLASYRITVDSDFRITADGDRRVVN